MTKKKSKGPNLSQNNCAKKKDNFVDWERARSHTLRFRISRAHLRALDEAVQPPHAVGPLQGVHVALDAQHGRGVDGAPVEDRAVYLALLHLQIPLVDGFNWPVAPFVALSRLHFGRLPFV